MPEICGDTVGNRLRGPPCFLLAGNPVGNAPIMTSTFKFGYLPKCIHYSISIAEKVSTFFGHFPKSCQYLFRYCSNGLQELLGAFHNMSWHTFGHFLYIFLEAACFCLLRYKIGDTPEIFKNNQRYFY
jgi:hypothetical protein